MQVTSKQQCIQTVSPPPSSFGVDLTQSPIGTAFFLVFARQASCCGDQLLSGKALRIRSFRIGLSTSSRICRAFTVFRTACLDSSKKQSIIRFLFGQVAQLVEQRIENPRVGGSIPSLATRTLFHLASNRSETRMLQSIAGFLLCACKRRRVVARPRAGLKPAPTAACALPCGTNFVVGFVVVWLARLLTPSDSTPP